MSYEDVMKLVYMQQVDQMNWMIEELERLKRIPTPENRK